MRQPRSSLATLAVLLALATVSESSLPYLRQVAFAQSPSPAQPVAVPEGTTVRVDGSTSMAAISQVLKQKFEAQFPGSKVEVQEKDTDDALKAVREDRADLAAIARSLTPDEQAQNLVQVPVTRRKIAIVVGDQNSFPGDMTGEQFAAIFRGEITNWSQLGGPDKRIRMVDRPTSDTRPALQPYPVFQAGEFKTGDTASPVRNDKVDAMIRKLGDDGISYALIDEVANKPGVRIISIYGTLPTDPSYPFSQPLTYVYKGPQPNPAVQAFLGYATSPDNQQTLATAGAPQGAVGNLAVPAPGVAPANPAQPAAGDGANAPQANAPQANGGSPTPANPAQPGTAPEAGTASPGEVAQAPAGGDVETERTGVPWWLWLLSIPLLGALLWTLFRGLDRSTESIDEIGAGGAVVGADRTATATDNRLVLVPRNSHEAYAYWEVPESALQRARKEEGGQQLALRLYDVTGLDFDRHPAHSIDQFDCEETDQDRHIAIPQSDRDYMAELGYVTYQGRWIKLAQSEAVHVPAEGADLSSPTATAPVNEPINTDLSEPSAPTINPPAFPAIPSLGTSFQSGGTPLVELRGFDTETNPTPDIAADITSDVTPDNPDYPELATSEGSGGLSGLGDAIKSTLAGGAIGAGIAGIAGATDEATQRSNRVRRSQIVMVPRNDQEAYVYWEVLDKHKEIAKQHGGQEFILRICDVTGVDLEHQAPHSIQQFNCEESDVDRHVTVPANGDYVAEIGYLASNGRWLRIARSAPVSMSEATS